MKLLTLLARDSTRQRLQNTCVYRSTNQGEWVSCIRGFYEAQKPENEDFFLRLEEATDIMCSSKAELVKYLTSTKAGERQWAKERMKELEGEPKNFFDFMNDLLSRL